VIVARTCTFQAAPVSNMVVPFSQPSALAMLLNTQVGTGIRLLTITFKRTYFVARYYDNRYACMSVLQTRSFHSSSVQRDIDQAAKYIGAGAAVVGVAGSGMSL
jgi:hypothetical protein